jgi:hypothetical protein
MAATRGTATAVDDAALHDERAEITRPFAFVRPL